MASSAVVGMLRVLLTANTGEFSTGLKAAANQMQAFSRDLNSMGRQMTSVGTSLTKTFTLPLLAIGAGSAKLAMDFESSFAGVRKTVDATDTEFATMAQGFRDLAKTIPVNVNELNKIGEAAGALGIKKGDILEFSSVMAQLGVTTNLTSDQAATSIAQIQNIFNASGKDTKNFASALVALGNAGASTESQIVDFATRLAGAGHQIGLSQQSVLGFSSALANMGLNAELGGTALSTVMSKISVAVDTGGKKLEGFAKVAGMTSESFKTLFKADAAEAILRFTEGLGKAGTSGENLTIILKDLGLKGSNVQDVMKRLAGGAGQMREAVELSSKAWQQNTALTEEARKRFETTQSQLTLLWNRIQDVGITIGNALLPTIKNLISAFNVVIPVFESLARGFAMMPSAVQTLVVAFGALVAAAGPALYIFGQLVTSAGSVAGAFGKKGIATRLLAGDLTKLEGSATTTTGALGLLGKTASVAGAAFVGWQIGRVIADLLGLDQKIADTITGINNLKRARDLAAQGKGDDAQADIAARIAALEDQRAIAIRRADQAQVDFLNHQIDLIKNDQTRLAIQDTINLAIQRGAAATTTYSEAVKFNEAWIVKQREAHQGVVAAIQRTDNAAEALTDKLDAQNTKLQEADAQIAQLSKTAREKLATAIQAGVFSVKELSEASGLSEIAIKRFTDQLKESTKEGTKHQKALEGQADAFAGLTVIKAATDALDALHVNEARGITIAMMTRDEQNKLNDIIKAAIKVYEAEGRIVPTELRKIYDETFHLRTEMEKLALIKIDPIKQLGTNLQGTTVENQIPLRPRSSLIADIGLPTEIPGLDKLIIQTKEEAKATEEQAKAAAHAAQINRTYSESLDIISQAFLQLAQTGGKAGALFQAGSGIVAGLKAADQANKQFGGSLGIASGLFSKNSTSAQKWASGVQSAGAIATGAMSVWADTAHAGSKAAGALSGAMSGAKAGAAFGPYGAAIGAAAGAVVGMIHAMSAGRREVKAFAESFNTAAAGSGFDELRAKLLVLGDEGERLWIKLTQQTKKGDKAGATAVAEEIAKALDAAKTKDAEFNTSLQGTLTQIQGLGGGISSALVPYLNSLKEAGRLTTENLGLLAQLSGEGSVDWKKIEDAAGRYGISTSKLGHDFNAAQLHESWQQIIDDLDLFSRGNVDVNGLLADMADEISGVVQKSIAFGTDIPENMRPWIEKLIAAGELVDANGDKITDIGKLKFGETLQTSLQNLTDTLKTLIENFQHLPGAIAAVPPRVDTDIYTHHHDTHDSTGDTSSADNSDTTSGAARGAFVGMGRLLPFAPAHFDAGGIVRSMWPKGFGTDTVPAWLTPNEGVLNTRAMHAIGPEVFNALNAGRLPTSDLANGIAPSGQTIQNNFNEGAFSFDGLVVDSSERAHELATQIAKEIHRGGKLLTDWQNLPLVKGA